MIAALQKFAHRIRIGPKPHPKKVTHNNLPAPLNKKLFDRAVAQSQPKNIHLPDHDQSQLQDEDAMPMWARAGSMSADRVADAQSHSPGATIQESEAQRNGVQFIGAAGDTCPSQGDAQITSWTPNGQQRMTTI